MGNRQKRALYDRPGDIRNQYVWPTRHSTKVALTRGGDRHGGIVKRDWNDVLTSRRDNNRIRRAADRAAIRIGLADHADARHPYDEQSAFYMQRVGRIARVSRDLDFSDLELPDGRTRITNRRDLASVILDPGTGIVYYG